jgi:hypothetical protein
VTRARLTPEQRAAEQTARIDAHVARLLAEAPPLTPEQCARLAALLKPYAGVTRGE